MIGDLLSNDCKILDLTTDLPSQFVRQLIQPIETRTDILARMEKAIELLNMDLGNLLKIHPLQWQTYSFDSLISALASILISFKNYQEQVKRGAKDA